MLTCEHETNTAFYLRWPALCRRAGPSRPVAGLGAMYDQPDDQQRQANICDPRRGKRRLDILRNKKPGKKDSLTAFIRGFFGFERWGKVMGAPALQAIETRYKGYRFRSRLEARWCVAFDHAGIHYEYEPQGYQVGTKAYLPDFHLPGLGFFEVKGTREYPADTYQAFANGAGEHLFVAVGGIPDPESFHGYLQSFIPAGNIDLDMGLMISGCGDDMFLRCSCCGRVVVWNEMYCTIKDNCGGCNNKSARMMPLHEAFSAARGARFEHGECG